MFACINPKWFMLLPTWKSPLKRRNNRSRNIMVDFDIPVATVMVYYLCWY